jgi:hypothetical protein
MYCPKCSQLQVSDQIQFCSSCGLSLNDIKELILADGKTKVSQPETREDKLSPRQKGVRQGVQLMLLSVVLIPAYILLAALFPANDRLIEGSVSDTVFEKVSQAILFTIFMFGLARVLYARFFEQGVSFGENKAETVQLNSSLVDHLNGSSTNYALPPSQSIPVSGFGPWRANTGELVQSPSVTEHTTKSLRKE